jgi:hypothetical protein
MLYEMHDVLNTMDDAFHAQIWNLIAEFASLRVSSYKQNPRLFIDEGDEIVEGFSGVRAGLTNPRSDIRKDGFVTDLSCFAMHDLTNPV